MKLKQINSVVLIFSFLTGACNKVEDVAFTDSAIIEGYITTTDNFKVTINRQIPNSSEAVLSNDDIDNLDVTVVCETSGLVYSLLSLGNGVYMDSSIDILEGDEYTLSFIYNGKSVSAYTYVPKKPIGFTQSEYEIVIEQIDEATMGPPGQGGSQPDPIEFSWDNEDESYYLMVVENLESTLNPIVDFGDETPPTKYFRKAPSTGDSELLNSREFQYYGTHRIILYHVLPDYATLYDENSTSSQNLTNPSTSIVNGYGIFSGLNSDTLYIEVTE
jgi:hypothetical protein